MGTYQTSGVLAHLRMFLARQGIDPGKEKGKEIRVREKERQEGGGDRREFRTDMLTWGWDSQWSSGTSHMRQNESTDGNYPSPD
jgi:hypothetical protein